MENRYSMSTGKISTGTLAAAAAKSLILLNPVTDPGEIIEVLLGFGAVLDQADVAAELYRVTTLGSPAGTSGTVVKDNPSASAADWTGLVNLTTEPTAVEVIRSFYVPVQKGQSWWAFPLGREIDVLGAGSRVGLRLVNDGGSSMTAVNCRATIAWEI